MTDAFDESLWERVRESLRADGLDPDEVIARAAANLEHYRKRPHEPTEEDLEAVARWICEAEEP